MVAFLLFSALTAQAVKSLWEEVPSPTSKYNATLRVRATTMDASNPYVATGFSDGFVMITKIIDDGWMSQKSIFFKQPVDDSQQIKSLDLSDDGVLLIGQNDGNVTMIWNIINSESNVEDKWKTYTVPHSNRMNTTAVTVVRRRGSRVVSGGDDGIVKIWTLLYDENSNLALRLDQSIIFKSGILAVSIRTDDEIAVSTWSEIPKTEQYTLSIIYNLTQTPARRENFYSDTPFFALDFSPDGRFIAAGAGAESSLGWVSIFKLNNTSINPKLDRFSRDDCIKSVRWSADQRFVLAGSRDDTVSMWKVMARYSENFHLKEFIDEATDAVLDARFFTNETVVFIAEDGTLTYEDMYDADKKLVIIRPDLVPPEDKHVAGIKKEEAPLDSHLILDLGDSTSTMNVSDGKIPHDDAMNLGSSGSKSNSNGKSNRSNSGSSSGSSGSSSSIINSGSTKSSDTAYTVLTDEQEDRGESDKRATTSRQKQHYKIERGERENRVILAL